MPMRIEHCFWGGKMNTVSKLINGKEIFYNRELDIISRNIIENSYFQKDGIYTRTISEGVYDTCFEITTKCNQCCGNCFAYSSPEKGEEMKYEYIEKMISKRESERIRIGITGGEPFLHSEIIKILELPYKFSNLNFMVSTNGNFELINKVEENLLNGKWLMSLSIHGNKLAHNLYTKSDSFDTAILNLSKLNEKLIIHTYTVINRFMTEDDVDFILNLQDRYRIFFTRFIIPRNVGRVDLQYNDGLLKYIHKRIKDNNKAGIKKDYSHTELINVMMKSRIIG